MADVIEYKQGGTSVRIEGLREVQRKLNKAGADAENMRQLMNRLGMIVVNAAAPPVLTGATRASLRAGKGKTKAVVRAGFARIPYVGRVHYGDVSPGIPGNAWLTKALASKRGEIFNALEKGIDELMKDADLK